MKTVKTIVSIGCATSLRGDTKVGYQLAIEFGGYQESKCIVPIGNEVKYKKDLIPIIKKFKKKIKETSYEKQRELLHAVYYMLLDGDK